eukprot:RCo050344
MSCLHPPSSCKRTLFVLCSAPSASLTALRYSADSKCCALWCFDSTPIFTNCLFCLPKSTCIQTRTQTEMTEMFGHLAPSHNCPGSCKITIFLPCTPFVCVNQAVIHPLLLHQQQKLSFIHVILPSWLLLEQQNPHHLRTCNFSVLMCFFVSQKK